MLDKETGPLHGFLRPGRGSGLDGSSLGRGRYRGASGSRRAEGPEARIVPETGKLRLKLEHYPYFPGHGDVSV